MTHSPRADTAAVFDRRLCELEDLQVLRLDRKLPHVEFQRGVQHHLEPPRALDPGAPHPLAPVLRDRRGQGRACIGCPGCQLRQPNPDPCALTAPRAWPAVAVPAHVAAAVFVVLGLVQVRLAHDLVTEHAVLIRRTAIASAAAVFVADGAE